MKSFIERSWQQHHPVMWLLWPLMVIYWLVSMLRRFCYRCGLLSAVTLPVPVIVVGNLTVGGNGKTPLVVWLVKLMQSLNYNVGVISRGYGGSNKDVLLVTPQTCPTHCGDEPKLIVNQTQCLMVVGADRVKAGQYLMAQALERNIELDFIISDDGLQHYRLDRAAELIVIDGKRRFGNNYLLPMGPNREGQWRLNDALMLINNGGPAKHREVVMTLAPNAVRRVKDNQILHLDLAHESVVAMAGIGFPQRFFDTLAQLGIGVEHAYEFADHQHFQPHLLQTLARDEQWLIMTEKDAVKCRDFAQDNWCYLPVEAIIDDIATHKLKQKLEELAHGI